MSLCCIRRSRRKRTFHEEREKLAERMRWQYCQIEVSASGVGVLKQFFADRVPVETDLHQGWPAMLAKLGEQGLELVSVFPHTGGLGRLPLTYVFKRPLISGG